MTGLCGTEIAVDDDGYLQNLHDWNEAIALQLAQQEALELDERHWEVLHLLRQFYQQYDLSPAMRPLVKYVAQQLGADKGKSIYLMQLFGASPAKMAAKIAGLPKPENCL